MPWAGDPRINLQPREAFPFDAAANGSSYLVFDRDAIFSAEVVPAIVSMDINPTRTSYQSPRNMGLLPRGPYSSWAQKGRAAGSPRRAVPGGICDRPGPSAGRRAAPPILLARRGVEAQGGRAPDCRTHADSCARAYVMRLRPRLDPEASWRHLPRAHHVRSGFGERQASRTRQSMWNPWPIGRAA